MTEPKWYDITAWPSAGYTLERLIPICEEHCERFVIGREHASTTQNEHFQMRVVFKIGKEMGAVINLFPGCHVSQSHVRDFNYCEKEGEFYRSWEKGLTKYQIVELKQWQGMAVALLKENDERSVHVLVDPVGGIGKTYLAKYCQVNHIAQYVPPMQDAQDFMAFAMAKPSKAYIFDMPRSESTKQRKGMWSAIEQIKNGYLYDKRYAFRDMWIEPPQILVITNETPDLECLSRDRWHFYKIGVFGELAEYEPFGATA